MTLPLAHWIPRSIFGAVLASVYLLLAVFAVAADRAPGGGGNWISLRGMTSFLTTLPVSAAMEWVGEKTGLPTQYRHGLRHFRVHRADILFRHGTGKISTADLCRREHFVNRRRVARPEAGPKSNDRKAITAAGSLPRTSLYRTVRPMKKYTKSMPSATDYSHLNVKIGLFFTLLMLPVIWIHSIWGLVMTNPPGSRNVQETPANPISANIVQVSRTNNGDYLDLEFFNGTRQNWVNVLVRRKDIEKYHQNQSVIIVRDDSPDARYDYCLLDDYVRVNREKKEPEQTGLWIGATVPVMLVYWFWKRRSRAKSTEQDLHGNNIPA